MNLEPNAPTGGGAARPSVSAGVRSDLRASSWRQRLLLVATVGWLAYEWGFGNEAFTPWLLFRVVSSTSGLRSVAAAAAVGFAFTTVQQLASGYTAAAGFSMFHRTTDAAWRLLRSRLGEEPRDWFRQPLAVRALVVFTLGTTAVVLIQMTTTGEIGVRRLRRVVNQAAVLCGAGVGAIGAAVAGAVWVGRSVPALESSTDWLLRILGNPLFWIGLLVLVVAGRRVVAGRSVSRP